MATKIISTDTSDRIRDPKTGRPFLFTLPKSKPVIALWSGGLDSTINIKVLLEEFKSEVYPVFINRGQTNYLHEKKSVEYFTKIFKKQYPNLFHEPKVVKLDTPAKAYKDALRKTKNLKDNSELRKRILYPARNPIIILTAVEYGYALQSKGKFPKTISVAFMQGDPALHSTLTSLRLLNLYVCHILDDFNWQLISIPLEKEFGNYYGTSRYVKWADEHHLEMSKTWSCYKDGETQCGKCEACKRRKRALSRVKDLTIYTRI